jgi:5-amino-6-(5-phosphoribosylamino)uracil reductase/diaminohydroxyphosphoribosylaminopyrimidine deaminase/5-amino-6-(5-phosphoribosylamino)uracil reductase
MIANLKVTLCYTQTLDGQLATRTGQSQWIGSGETLRLAHELRASHAAIMVGVGTVLADNPRLTVRLVAGRDPLRIVVDSSLRTPLNAAVLADGAAVGTWVATTHSADLARANVLRSLGATVLPCAATATGRVDLRNLLGQLAAHGMQSVMVEGGAALITALLQQRLATHAVITVAPTLMGSGIAAIGDLGVTQLSQLVRLSEVQVRQFGPDTVFDGQLEYAK